VGARRRRTADRPRATARAAVLRRAGRGPAAALGLAALPVLSEVRIRRAARPPSERWRWMAVEPRGTTQLGLSFRPRQAETFGLDPRTCLARLLAHPFQVLRLGVYWDRAEPEPGVLRTDELDWQLALAEASGRRVILCVGAVKTFGYPEFFVPAHHLRRPLREGALIEPHGHQHLLEAASAHVTRVVERYRDRPAVVAWQVEHEAVDPLGMEHSWRLATTFVAEEVRAVRSADPSRPVLMNGFLPTSLLVRAQQWWRTRDQGDSLVVARGLADIVGVDHYPRHAVLRLGGATVYLDGSRRPWQRAWRRRAFAGVRASGRRLIVTEGQAEPWEAVTTPPSPAGRQMASCLPEQVIATYNQCLGDARAARVALDAYLFWGAEYWVLRADGGDPSYLEAFSRLLALAGR